MRGQSALIRLGLVAGALFYTPPALAQIAVPPASEVPLPTKPKTDSGPDTTKIKPDTVKPPVGRFSDPKTSDEMGRTEWSREELFASGALTLIDLLDRVPEVTTFRSGWIATPHFAGYNGDARSVRVFYDDIEIDDLDKRNGGALDLATVQIWTLERVILERSAAELRIHLRSWRVDRTTPYTRTDITTGNENTNIYRGFYGSRGGGGQIFQAGGQQYGTTSTHFAGSGDALSLLGRVGIARKSWSIDAFVNRTHSNRATQVPIGSERAIPPLNATHTLAYIRAGAGNVEKGPWLQLVAAALQFRESSAHTNGSVSAPTTSGGIAVPRDTADSTTSQRQLALTGGFSLGPAKLRFQQRFRIFEHHRDYGPSGGLQLSRGANGLSASVESDAFRHITVSDVTIHLQPLSFIALTAGAGHRTASIEPGGGPAGKTVRANGSLRLKRMWLSGGIVTSDTSSRAGLLAYDTSYRAQLVGRSTGVTTSLRGPVWRGIGVDSWITHWSNPAAYQPRYQARAELNFASSFLNRFPKGDFGVKASASLEYRSRIAIPSSTGFVGVGSGRTLNSLLEVRILRGVISYQQRNILGYPYEIIPGYLMPRALAIYGVRWEFWN